MDFGAGCSRSKYTKPILGPFRSIAEIHEDGLARFVCGAGSGRLGLETGVHHQIREVRVVNGFLSDVVDGAEKEFPGAITNQSGIDGCGPVVRAIDGEPHEFEGSLHAVFNPDDLSVIACRATDRYKVAQG